mgnify:FL=1
MGMQFRDLKKQYDVLKAEIDNGIKEVIETTSFISGVQVEQLEDELAEYVGVKHCVTCANGTDALSMALMAWNLKEGECAFVPDFTFFASGETVAFEGATPVFVDVDERTYNMNPEKLELAIQRVLEEGKLIPRVIVAVDLFGLPADYEAIRPIADKYGLKILEDGAQGFGGEINGKRACSFGDISTTSFFPAKPLGCYGDGGAIFTDDDEIDAYLRSIRVHGKGSFKYDNVRIGWNSRLDTIQAAILLPKLHAFVEYERDNVNKVATKYTEGLKELVVTPEFDEKYISSWAQYCIQLKSEEERDSLQIYLKEQGIPAMVYYPKPMHKQEAFANLRLNEEEYSVTNRLCKLVLELPMHPYMEEADVDAIVKKIADFLNNR